MLRARSNHEISGFSCCRISHCISTWSRACPAIAEGFQIVLMSRSCRPKWMRAEARVILSE